MANSSAPAGEGARRQLRAWRDSLGSVRERLAVQFETDARGTTLHGNQNSTSNTSRFEGNDAASGPPSLRAMYSGSMETEAAAVRGGQGAFAAVARRSVLQKESPRQPGGGKLIRRYLKPGARARSIGRGARNGSGMTRRMMQGARGGA